MRWLIVAAILDLFILFTVVTTQTTDERADFVFVSGSEHTFLDPQRASWLHDLRIIECLYEPLVKVKLPELTIEPAAATSWKISDDGRVYTFHIRPEARWSNNDPLTAHDFVYAWRRALMPDFAADYTQLFWCIQGAEQFFNWRNEQLKQYVKDKKTDESLAKILVDKAYRHFDQTVGLKALDEKTLQVTLAHPTPYFIDLCGFAVFNPVHGPSVERSLMINPDTGMLVQQLDWTRPGRLVSNGPYVLARRRFKRDLLLKQNPYFWNKAAMANTSIQERFVEEASTALLMYENGEVDYLPDISITDTVAGNLVEEQRKGLRHDVFVSPAAGTYFYNFNCQKTLPGGRPNPFTDPRVRRALSMSIDRQSIVENISRVGQPPANTFIPLGAIPGYNPPVQAGVHYDPKRARELLAEAGYPDGRGLEGLSILYNSGAKHEIAAQRIKRGWEEQLNVSVALEGVETTVFSHRLKKHIFSISRAGWYGDYRDPTTFLDKFISNNGNNDAAYSNPRYDRLMKQASLELNTDKRMKLLEQAEAMMLRDQPIAPIYQYVLLDVFNPDRVKHLYPNAWKYRRFEFVQVRR